MLWEIFCFLSVFNEEVKIDDRVVLFGCRVEGKSFGKVGGMFDGR